MGRHNLTDHYTQMPLVRLYTRQSLTKAVPLKQLQTKLCAIWKVKPETTKLLLTKVDDWTGEQFDEDVYVSIRANAKPDRTPTVINQNLLHVQAAFRMHDLIANIRLETFNGDEYFHCPPK